MKFSYKFYFQKLPLQVVFFFSIIFFSGSCKKFLDVPRNSQVSLLNSVADCQAILDNPSIRQRAVQDGLRGTDDYYFTDADYNSLTIDVEREFYTWLPTAQRLNPLTSPDFDWRLAYLLASNANVAIEALQLLSQRQSGIENGDDYRYARGMALFIRAFCFYQIATDYSKLFNQANANIDAGVPVPQTADINLVQKRGTVKQTYDRITADLKEALELLPAKTDFPTRPNKASVHALQARIYLSMENYNAAMQAATAALDLKSDLVDYNSINKISDGPFPPWIKEVIYVSGIPAISKARVDTNLVKSYTPNDLRKEIFFKANTGTDAGSYVFKGSYGGSTSNYFNGLAVDELYLIKAECEARAGNTASAMNDLNTLLRKRWVTGTYTDLTVATPQESLAIVLTERRKELVMRGLRWADLKRLNNDPNFAVTLTRIIAGQTFTLPPNDLRYQLLLPRMVIAQSTMEQNPR